MHVIRVFNNNVVLAKSERGEVIVTGRGIGHGISRGAELDPTQIQKVYVPTDGRDPDHLGIMIAQIDPDVLFATSQSLVDAHAPAEFTDSVPLITAIADHLNQATKRIESGQSINYPLEAEVRHLYPEELQVARDMLDSFNTRLDANLPENEAIALALHLVNAGFNAGDLSNTYKMTGIIEQMLAIIAAHHGHDISRTSVGTARFITHVRYLFVRLAAGEQLVDGQEILNHQIRHSYADAYECATKLSSLIELRFDTQLSDDEISYLTLHIARMKNQ